MDFSAVLGYVEKAIAWIEKTGIIEKIPTYVGKLLDLVAQYLPKITELFGKIG